MRPLVCERKTESDGFSSSPFGKGRGEGLRRKRKKAFLFARLRRAENFNWVERAKPSP
jgi:hypothetical protein